MTTVDIVAAVSDLLSRTRVDPPTVDADSKLDDLGLESIDYVEVFIAIEERTGAIFDLSTPPPRLEIVADLGGYRQVHLTAVSPTSASRAL